MKPAINVWQTMYASSTNRVQATAATTKPFLSMILSLRNLFGKSTVMVRMARKIDTAAIKLRVSSMIQFSRRVVLLVDAPSPALISSITALIRLPKFPSVWK